MQIPFETLYDPKRDVEIILPSTLAQIYGRLDFPNHAGRSYVISNFVTTLDGVTTLGIKGYESGKYISGSNQHDRMLMGLLRAVADAVVIATGTLRVVPRGLWTAENVYPNFADEFRALRQMLKKPESPLNVIVTGSGNIDPSLPVFQSGRVPTLIVTTAEGSSKISKHSLPSSTRWVEATRQPRIAASELIDAVTKACGTPDPLLLIEGGPQLMSTLFAEHLLDEQFLTLAPQIAGRDDTSRRPGLVAGQVFAPESEIWGTLVGIKRVGEHLFLRYAFESKK
ncbi:MAG: dihydrofolate reductase family protein [Chloroflexi bacterium]|nr:dihydrofolate reductase family protein [Chloroflexota bacterium]